MRIVATMIQQHGKRSAMILSPKSRCEKSDLGNATNLASFLHRFASIHAPQPLIGEPILFVCSVTE